MSDERFAMLSVFRRRDVDRTVRMMAAQGQLAVSAGERLAILALLQKDNDDEIRAVAAQTLGRMPIAATDAPRPVPGVPEESSEICATGPASEPPSSPPAASGPPAGAPSDDANVCEGCDGAAQSELADADEPSWIDEDPMLQAGSSASREGILQRLGKMNFSDRLKAAMKGSREVRAILIRDPSKLIAAAVLKSPKLTEPEVESFARLGNVAEDILRTIGNNRAWMKNYGVVLALTKNAKTPLAISLHLLNRLNDRDVTNLSSDRNVPEPLRVAARKRVVSAVSRR